MTNWGRWKSTFLDFRFYYCRNSAGAAGIWCHCDFPAILVPSAHTWITCLLVNYLVFLCMCCIRICVKEMPAWVGSQQKIRYQVSCFLMYIRNSVSNVSWCSAMSRCSYKVLSLKSELFSSSASFVNSITSQMLYVCVLTTTIRWGSSIFCRYRSPRFICLPQGAWRCGVEAQ